ncbi:unnamed protein product [Gordionus sp. m RMFG-2023]
MQINIISNHIIFNLFLIIEWLFGMNSMLNKKFEYKHSFSRPILIGPDNKMFLWNIGGNAIISQDGLRLAPSLNSQKGWAWNKLPWNHQDFEVIASVKIAGHGKLGADGLAIWFNATNQGGEGSTFGSLDLWNGLGIFLDSYDNDHLGDNPYIGVMVNNGTQIFDQSQDGKHQLNGGCVAHFRNQPLPTFLNISYYQKTLVVSHGIGANLKSVLFMECFRGDDIELPSPGYFGLSAATGGLADDHDVYMFSVYSLTLQSEHEHSQISTAPPDKIDDEFKEFYEKLNKQKEEYIKEHPDRERQPWESEEDWMDTLEGKELRLILEGQNRIEHLLNSLTSNIDHLSNTAGHKIEGQANYLPHLQEYSKQISDLKFSFDALNKQMINIKNAPPSSYSDKEIKEEINHMKEALYRLVKKTRDYSKPVNCLTPIHFVIFAVLQICILTGYIIYKSHNDQKSKKLF